jgi:hypothetical protein
VGLKAHLVDKAKLKLGLVGGGVGREAFRPTDPYVRFDVAGFRPDKD